MLVIYHTTFLTERESIFLIIFYVAALLNTSNSAPPFSNPQFDASFAGAFTGFAKFGDPNVHPVSQIITPRWNTFKPHNSEMLFNRTASNQPDIRQFTTDPGLLSRCA
jgi:hypothetical protein